MSLRGRNGTKSHLTYFKTLLKGFAHFPGIPNTLLSSETLTPAQIAHHSTALMRASFKVNFVYFRKTYLLYSFKTSG